MGRLFDGLLVAVLLERELALELEGLDMLEELEVLEEEDSTGKCVGISVGTGTADGAAVVGRSVGVMEGVVVGSSVGYVEPEPHAAAWVEFPKGFGFKQSRVTPHVELDASHSHPAPRADSSRASQPRRHSAAVVARNSALAQSDMQPNPFRSELHDATSVGVGTRVGTGVGREVGGSVGMSVGVCDGVCITTEMGFKASHGTERRICGSTEAFQSGKEVQA